MSSKLAHVMAFAAVTICGGAAFAQDSVVETVVVTGSRLSSYESGVTPHVTLTRRADHVITTVRLVCDTREKERRIAELKDTMRAMLRAASGKAISLGVSNDDVVRDLNEAMFDDLVRSDNRPDTSYATVVLKTAVTESDTFESATARLRNFIDRAERVGRTEITRDARWDLTLVGPERNRDELIRMIVGDAKRTAGVVGGASTITIEGLQRPIEWYRAGPLGLALYIPYRLEIAQK